MSVDIEKVKMSIRAGIPLTVTTYTLPLEMEIYISNVLSAFLSELNQQHMIQYLEYCLRELMINAKRANTKRVYFQEKGLDITNEADYDIGMKTFKEDTLKNINHYLMLQRKAGLYVKFLLQMKNDKIKIEIRNNADLTVFEYKRIHDKLARAQQYTSVDEAMQQVLDETEGAGLGLVIIILMLEKIGLTEENFQTSYEKGETITSILLPLNEITRQELDVISREFANAIHQLPQIPDNIIRISKLLDAPDVNMVEIAQQISKDVSLTAELLKFANSPSLALSSPCSNVIDAVKLIGIRGIKNIIFGISSLKVMKNFSGVKKEIWEHAQQVAFYSYNLARNFCAQERSIIDDSYICGLLHDIGRVVFEKNHPNLLEKIARINGDASQAKDVIEKLVAGVNHGEIGAQIAEQWNFPENIIHVIRYHHSPESAPVSVRKLTSLVYLANLLAHYKARTIDYYQIDSNVLKMFNITSEKQFQIIEKKLSDAFSLD